MIKTKLSGIPAAGLRVVCRLALLAVFAATVASLRADNPPTFLFQFGSYGAGNGQFSGPTSLAINSSNNVFVVDGNNNRIEIFDRNGDYLSQWGSFGTSNGQFSGPAAIAIDGSNNVYVADTGNNRIEKFDLNGSYLSQWGSFGSSNGQLSAPTSIAIDGSNNVYVADQNNWRIEKFDSNGNYLTNWGSFGSGNGQFSYPGGVAVDGSYNVYVVDSGNNRIEKFNSNGIYLTQLGGASGSNGPPLNPVAIAVDSSNNLYEAEYGSFVQKFDSSGNFLTQWYGYGFAPSTYIMSLAVDQTGNDIFLGYFYPVATLSQIQVFINNTNIGPPFITQQPASESVPAGTSVSLGVIAVGASPLSYQWTSNTLAVPGATNPVLTLTNVAPSDSATYAVLITNSLGSVLSSNAVLTVLPALVTTFGVSGITATSAVLHGSVTIGSDETLAWFEWGTDTSYGNITGITTVPGGAGTAAVTNTLNGLDGDLIYHYRIVAANDFGIVYGNDQQFQVGLRPVLVNAYASTQTNSGSLNANVNPEGRDTTVFFRWGLVSTTNTPPPLVIGSGSAPLTVGTPITGLTAGATYHFTVTASNSAGTFLSAISNFQAIPWNSNTSPYLNWQSIASSADGTKLAAVPYGGQIYTSTNSGTTWITNNPSGNWISIASSADGVKLVAAIGGFFTSQAAGPIYTSTNSGLSWSNTIAPHWHWTCVASSADGVKLAAVAVSGGICTSTNSGATWTSNNVPTTNWICIASSADGNSLVAAVNGGLIYTSTNAGGSWITNNAPATNWQSVASSVDGLKLAAAAGGYSSNITAGVPGPIYTSTNGGTAWLLRTNAPIKDWFSVASSADGNKLVAVAFSTPLPGLTNSIFTSTDAGATWNVSDAPGTAWEFAASSADGSKFAALANNNFSGTGRIYTEQTTPTPLLELTPSATNLMLSWTILSLNFALQQNPDLNTTNWTVVTNQFTLNLTNLQNQVLLPLSASNSFYRLIH